MPYRPPDVPATLRPRVVSTRLHIAIEPTQSPTMTPELLELRAEVLAEALNRVYGPDTFTVEPA